MKYLDNYRQLISKVDAFCDRVMKELSDHVACRPGCDGCCRHLSLFPVEAASIASALGEAPALALQIREHARLAHPDGKCPLLIEGRCALYQWRPVICRTHGLPLLVRQGDGPRIDHCPLNFQQLESLPGHLILDIEPLNTMLVSVNALFMTENKRIFPTNTERLTIAEALLLDL